MFISLQLAQQLRAYISLTSKCRSEIKQAQVLIYMYKEFASKMCLNTILKIKKTFLEIVYYKQINCRRKLKLSKKYWQDNVKYWKIIHLNFIGIGI